MAAVIFQASPANLSHLVELEEELFLYDRISPRQFRYLLTRAQGKTFILKDNEEIRGYLTILQRSNSRKLRIYSLGVREASQKKGYGLLLLQHAEKFAVDHAFTMLTLEVRTDNLRTVTFYQNYGFTVFGKKEHYYDDGCTALLLRKNILKGTLQ